MPVDIYPLLPARVYRFYRGRALLSRLRGGSEEDGPFPEDWIGLVSAASNPGRDDPEEGLARLADGRLLRDAIESDPDFWLGADHVRRFGTSTGLLVKLLDAAERLPVHAHPNRVFAHQHLASRFGKTEAWIVLATRKRDRRGPGRSPGCRRCSHPIATGLSARTPPNSWSH